MKKILGLDLGTNSIGWAVLTVDEESVKKIDSIGSRIIPMDATVLNDFDKGNSISQTKYRTEKRGMRRLRERKLLRRERLLRVLHILGFLPKHFDIQIGFDENDNKTFGKFINYDEPKIAWHKSVNGNYEFIFQDSFEEMLSDFKQHQPDMVANGKKVPYDWTIYFLRKKALSERISKAELAWILLSFNQKRGYFQFRGEVDDNIDDDFFIISSEVLEVNRLEKDKKNDKYWYEVLLENNRKYTASFINDISVWKGGIREFLVKTKKMKDGNIKEEIYYMPTFDEIEQMSEEQKNKIYTKIKLKTEKTISESGKTVGTYIYDNLLKLPDQKIRGKLIRTIDRKYYYEELKAILKKQMEFHKELSDQNLYEQCIHALYINNVDYRNSITNRDFSYLLLDNIIFYQRPLKSKKSLISNCPYEERVYLHPQTKEYICTPIKCIAKSHPVFQEFRLWQFISNLRIYEIEKEKDVTHEFLPSVEEYVKLFTWLNDKSNGKINQKDLFTNYFKKGMAYRWNYVEDKDYPCNETRSTLIKYLSVAHLKNGTQVLETIGHNIYQSEINALKHTLDKTCDDKKKEKMLSLLKDKEKAYQLAKQDTLFIQQKAEEALWHILYSIETETELKKGLKKFAEKHSLSENFVSAFMTIPPFKKEYGSYSEKAIKRLLPLMRIGKYWSEKSIDNKTNERIDKIITGECDETIRNRVREKAINLRQKSDFQNLPLWLACYIVYNRYSEVKEICKWENPEDIDNYLKYHFKQHSLRNPIVEQVIKETLLTVRDIWKSIGQIDEIHLELGREMKNPADKRKIMTKNILENEKTNLRIKAMLSEFYDLPDFKDEKGKNTIRPYSPSQQDILRLYEEFALSNLKKDDVEYDFITGILKKNQPSKTDIIRYKCWLEQKYQSPYTGKVIPLGKLFTSAYEIEHIIPQSRYFDDSFSNKVICEVEVNKLKDNMLGYEFIKKHHGEKVTLSEGRGVVEILSVQKYEEFVTKCYSSSQARIKKQKLLMEDIPDKFIERQLNDTRYISKYIKCLLSNIVRGKDVNGEYEQEATSKNLISCSGSITDRLKKDWGLNDVWNRIILPRFERMNDITGKDCFTTLNRQGHKIPNMPLELQEGFNKKRIDHRHHAMDALVIACTTRDHVNLLNNEAAKSKNMDMRYQLSHKLRKYEKEIINGEERNVPKEFKKPWETFTQDAYDALKKVVVSFKQDLRVINKPINYYEHFENGKKVLKKQLDGNSWSIRKSLHKDTVFGEVNLRLKKTVKLKDVLKTPKSIVERELKNKILELLSLNYTEKQIENYFKDNKDIWNDINLNNIDIYYFTKEKNRCFATRKDLITVLSDFKNIVKAKNEEEKKKFEKKNRAIIESITDESIQKILMAHLAANNNDSQVAFSAEGIDEMNRNIVCLNNGKFHKPIKRVRVYEQSEIKFSVGQNGSKAYKFVEADKGTNLFFVVCQKEVYDKESGVEKKVREFTTIPLRMVINCQKNYGKNWQWQFETFLKKEKIIKQDSHLLFVLSPNDLVYVPTEKQIQNGIFTIDREHIYIVNDFNDSTIYFRPVNFEKAIAEGEVDLRFDKDKMRNIGSYSHKTATFDGVLIKTICVPLVIDRLGNVSLKKF